jgi:hypothetical protein
MRPLQHNTGMPTRHSPLRRPSHQFALVCPFILGLALAAIGTSISKGGSSVAAQGQNPCALLTVDEVHALAPKDAVGNGVPSAIASNDFFACQYRWGMGAGRYSLEVSVNPASRAFAGTGPDSIKQGLLSSVAPGTMDAAIPEVGDAAVFKAYSPAYAGASAYVKDRILQVNLDGVDAREKKAQLISLLKLAVSRL